MLAVFSSKTLDKGISYFVTSIQKVATQNQDLEYIWLYKICFCCSMSFTFASFILSFFRADVTHAWV